MLDERSPVGTGPDEQQHEQGAGDARQHEVRGAQAVADAGDPEPGQHHADERAQAEDPAGAVGHLTARHLRELEPGRDGQGQDQPEVTRLEVVAPGREQERDGRDEPGEHGQAPPTHVRAADPHAPVGLVLGVVRQPDGVQRRAHARFIGTLPRHLDASECADRPQAVDLREGNGVGSAGGEVGRGAAAPGAADVELVVEEGGDLRPDLGDLGVVLRPQRVVGGHERVAGALVDRDGHVLAEAEQVGLEGGGLVGREEVVVLGHVALDGRLDLRQVGRAALDRREAVERHRGLDPVGALRSEHEREHPAHAEPDDPDAVAGGGGVVGQEVDRTAHVARRTVDRQALHQLARLVHLVVSRQLAVVQVGCEGHETGRSEPVGHLLGAGVEAPPLLDDDHARPRARLGQDQVAPCVVAVARELNHLSHGSEPTRTGNLVAA